MIVGTTCGGYAVSHVQEKLIELGNNLARSIGHAGGKCPKVSHAVPCTCGSGEQQSIALANWNALVQSIKES